MSLPDADYAELLRKYERKPLTTSLEQQYCLLNYVTENWVWHTQYFEQHSHGRWRKFHDLALIKTLSFDFRPWTTVYSAPKELRHLSIFRRSLENGHQNLLLLLQGLPERPLKACLEYWAKLEPRNIDQDLIESNALDVLVDECPSTFQKLTWESYAVENGCVPISRSMLESGVSLDDLKVGSTRWNAL